ncbi:hypothetical protein L6164_013306 [Bauhinia variegata]|uniref:Uncharacterized protein n=1 Tax=Bauhinia variegata TaxID=167791 RepID=A0ACB9PC66_BAUVA|nr:hypothetical protein L6164_013306 [Bauhinia variegata]
MLDESNISPIRDNLCGALDFVYGFDIECCPPDTGVCEDWRTMPNLKKLIDWIGNATKRLKRKKRPSSSGGSSYSETGVAPPKRSGPDNPSPSSIAAPIDLDEPPFLRCKGMIVHPPMADECDCPPLVQIDSSSDTTDPIANTEAADINKVPSASKPVVNRATPGSPVFHNRIKANQRESIELDRIKFLEEWVATNKALSNQKIAKIEALVREQVELVWAPCLYLGAPSKDALQLVVNYLKVVCDGIIVVPDEKDEPDISLEVFD